MKSVLPSDDDWHDNDDDANLRNHLIFDNDLHCIVRFSAMNRFLVHLIFLPNHNY